MPAPLWYVPPRAVAYLALVKAVDNFDPDRGTGFLGYATPVILGEIKTYFRDATWDLHVPRAMQELTQAVRTAAGVYSITSLDRPARGEPAQASLVEFIGAEDPRIESVIDRTAVKPLIASLDDRDRQILLMRYFQDMTQREIGARLGYSQMHVSRLLAAIFARLRGALS